MTSREIRQAFLAFFEEHDHRVVASSPLVIPTDPTLLFANAGMNQFKDVFTGRERRDYRRAASAQKCLRVSGKHNDLEMVGRTPRHHTFFEMLGNFSFGDYFKQDAIVWAWDLITKVYGLPQERLWVSVFGGSASAEADEQAARIWQRDVGVPPERILRLGEEENFWRMGDTGPCGPCSEIHFDLGERLTSVEGPSTPETDERRFLEIWNLVFMQFDQREDGELEPLPAPSIDTGMGLERVTAVLQGRESNYETDLFVPILQAAAARAGVEYGRNAEADLSLRVIGDHARALCFLVADGVVPTNDSRGYVLRRILRRAIRHGRKLGIEAPFLHEVTPVVIELMGEDYPELRATRDAILEVGRLEERRFAETLTVGVQLLDEKLEQLDAAGADPVFPGSELFRLYDTFGLPLDLAEDIVRERGLRLDMQGFEAEMAQQRARARESWKRGRPEQAAAVYQQLSNRLRTRFTGHKDAALDGVRMLAILEQGESVQTLTEGHRGEVILEATPFYAEAGGQVGDRGWLAGPDGRAEVLDTQRPVEGLIVHHVEVESGMLAVDQTVHAEIDAPRREAVRRNHTATHLLHAALRDVVGPHVKQAGSLVAPDRLRFDFSHFAGLGERTLADIENEVNQQIMENHTVRTREMALDEALRGGAMALFGEKYGERVRVVSIGEFSTELCGGTHCRRSGDIGLMKLVQERGIASGTRRVEAVTGHGSLERFRQQHEILRTLEELLSVPEDGVVGEFEKRLEQLREVQRELEATRVRAVREELGRKVERAPEVGGIRVVAERVEGLSAQELRSVADNLRQRLGSGVIVLGRAEGGKASLLVAVTDDLKQRVPAGKLVGELAKIIGGGGGGRDDMAEAGGRDVAKLDDALRASLERVAARAEVSG